MPNLDGTKTHDNLKEAFAGESQANRRYLYFAQKADVEGTPTSPRSSARSPRVRPVTRSVTSTSSPRSATRSTGVARRRDRRQPQVGDRRRDLRVHRDVPGLRAHRRDEGFEEVAEWLETLARAEKSHAGRFQAGLESIS